MPPTSIFLFKNTLREKSADLDMGEGERRRSSSQSSNDNNIWTKAKLEKKKRKKMCHITRRGTVSQKGEEGIHIRHYIGQSYDTTF